MLPHEAHHRWLRHIGGHPIETILAELLGEHLACWCALLARGEADHGHAATRGG